jgi:hypothetical protein
VSNQRLSNKLGQRGKADEDTTHLRDFSWKDLCIEIYACGGPAL